MKIFISIAILLFAMHVQGQNKLAQEGDAVEQYKYADQKWTGGDKKTAFEWYIKSAKQANAAAQWKLGNIYSRGDYVQENEKKAIYWYELAANNANNTDPHYDYPAYAAYSLGYNYYYGKGIEKNEEKGLSYWVFAINNQSNFATKRGWFQDLYTRVLYKWDVDATPDIIKIDLKSAKKTAALKIAFELSVRTH